MQSSVQIVDLIAQFKLLSHPFYQAWQMGKLSREALQNYAVQYNPFVQSFPNFVSRIHSHCQKPTHRRQLLINLNEEEGFPNGSDHPSLWKKFARGLGVSDADFQSKNYRPESLQLEQEFFGLCSQSYASGLGALFAYEQQMPEISKVKTEGLQKFYGIMDEECTEFFRVHEVADQFHSESLSKMIDELSGEEAQVAQKSAGKAACALWNFLSSCELH